jgi:serine/threonine protein kinase/Tol biopolymer transport system component
MTMSLSTGSRLGPYEIVGLLGTGGMGEVYRARDSRLHREVALKILPEATWGDSAAEARFEREAKAIASVNHPNICAVHDVGIDGGRRFLVMELLEGETLQQRLRRGAFDTPELMEHAAALADALQAAHARGIIHRDLKPGNIFLTSRGQLKILDFGLAKATDSPDSPDGQTHAADDLITGRGIAVGTAAYMSPEQIRGELLDARTDVFSLGLVLYEMTTGQRAFSGSTGAAVAASILNHEPTRPGTLRAGLPSKLEEAILTALEKDRDLRYQSAADLRADLKRIRRQLSTEVAPSSEGAPSGRPIVATHGTTTEPPAGGAGPSSSSDTQLLGAIISRHRLWAGAAALVVVIAVAALWLLAHPRKSGATAPVFTDLQVQPLTFDGETILGTISPDGRFVIYLRSRWAGGVFVRQISGGTDVPLVPPGTFSRISSMTVTPDGNFVDLVAVTGSALVPDAWRVPLLGGQPRQLLSHVVTAIGWSPDGQTMAFVRSEDPAKGMTVVTADPDGSNQRELVTRRPPKMFFGDVTTNVGRPPSRPAWSPDGKLLLLAAYSVDSFPQTSDLVVLDVRTGAERPSISINGIWAEVAWLDQARLLLLGGVGTSGLWISDLTGNLVTPVTREFGNFANMSLTADRKTAVAKRFTRSSGIWVGSASGADAELRVRLSPAGAALPILDADDGLTYTAFKPDGVNAAYQLVRGMSTPTQIVDRTPIPPAGAWLDVSSDGRTIVYAQMDLPNALYRVMNDGSGRVALVDADSRSPRLTADGKVLFARTTRPGLFSVPLGGGTVQELSKRVVLRDISVSPDGRRVLFGTDKPGIVILCDLPDCANPKDLSLRSAYWAPDGAGVAYVQDSTTIMEQPLDGGPPRRIAHLDGDEPIINFRWSPDGSRLATSRGRYPNDLVLIKGFR